MTEDLWYHALKFLDRYRTDVRSYDISELYEFADETGILERHKQMLAGPFQDSQVDMKIMYYELIRMLIDTREKIIQKLTMQPRQWGKSKVIKNLRINYKGT